MSFHKNGPNDESSQDDKDELEKDFDVGSSPNYFASPKKGTGVRRLNNLPLIGVAGVMALVVLGVSYTFFKRQTEMHTSQSIDDSPHSMTIAVPPVKPTGIDYVPPSEPLKIATDVSVQPVKTGNQLDDQLSVPDMPSPKMQRFLQKEEQLEDKRLAQWDEAMQGEASVHGFGANLNAQNSTQQISGQQSNSRINGNDLINRYLATTASATGSAATSSPDGFNADSNNSMASENQQDRKQAFLAGTPEAATYLAHQRKAAIAPSQEIKAGWVIPGVLISGIDSDLPGPIVGQVRAAVYDSATGTQCLIPPASRLMGKYSSYITLGQTRVQVVWQRIIYPDGSSLSLENMPGADIGGYAGFHDQVDNHYMRIFGSGLMLSAFSAGIQLSQPQAKNGDVYSSAQIIAGSLGQQMGQLGMQMAQRNMNIQPNIKIRPGYKFNIEVTKDIILPTWEGHSMAGSSGKGC
ncbi:MAG: TrbI/VirB10 family protein [Gammaproteobacteria bacterium]